jgi:hypothetical protein
MGQPLTRYSSRAARGLCARCSPYEDPEYGFEKLLDALRRLHTAGDQMATRDELLERAQFHDAEAARLRLLAASRP